MECNDFLNFKLKRQLSEKIPSEFLYTEAVIAIQDEPCNDMAYCLAVDGFILDSSAYFGGCAKSIKKANNHDSPFWFVA